MGLLGCRQDPLDLLKAHVFAIALLVLSLDALVLQALLFQIGFRAAFDVLLWLRLL